MSTHLSLTPIEGLPLIQPGDDLAKIIASALTSSGITLVDLDVVVVAQKIVSKSEGRYLDLASIQPTAEALKLADATLKDPRLVQAILDESTRVVRHQRNVLIVQHRLGYVMANAGIDQSNIDSNAAAEPILLLPKDPDQSAERLRAGLGRTFRASIGVVVSDSFGRPFRLGTVGVALGAAGLPSLIDMRGKADLSGRTLQVTEVALADEIASAASLLMGQSNEGLPVVIVRGLKWNAPDQPATSLVRSADDDLFR